VDQKLLEFKRKMKNLIYQVKVGPTPPAFYDVCIKSVEEYCKKYNIKHIVETEAKLKIRPLNSHRSEQAVERLGYLPIFEKQVAFDYLDDYDNICVIDADIFIRENAPNIFEELDDDTVFAGVYEKDMPLTTEYQKKITAYSNGQYGTLRDTNMITGQFGIAFYNMGLMLFSNKLKKYLNGDTPEQFIRRKEFEEMVNGKGNWRWSTDQTIMNVWVHQSGMRRKELNWRWNTLFKGVEDTALTESYFLHFFLSNNLPKGGEEIPEIIMNLDKALKIKNHG